MGNESDIANAVIFFSSGLSSYITGHNLIVDGGYSVS
jgi:enoyl-[acyl-carrier-protein] reductase (NADH)